MASNSKDGEVPDSSASHPFTCNTCQVAYRSITSQKGHMKSDWHRYNLKRRVASLPPISADIFTEKVLQARAASTAEAGKAYFEKVCPSCNKTYYSANAFTNHLSSLRHRQSATSQPGKAHDETLSIHSSTFSLGEPVAPSSGIVGQDAEVEFSEVISRLRDVEIDEQHASPVKRPGNPQAGLSASAEEAATATSGAAADSLHSAWTSRSCLFCNYKSSTTEANVLHMERFHGMFVPEKGYLVDLEGLIGYLHSKIYDLQQCLSCGRNKSTIFAIQTHMRDKGHCKIPFTTEAEQLEIGDFYDFQSTYSDDGSQRDTSSRHIADADNDEGWETDSSSSSTSMTNITIGQNDGDASTNGGAFFFDEYELHLPSGKAVGHRSLNRYYRQNLANYPSPEERAERIAITDTNHAVDHNGQQRQLLPRDNAGLMGVHNHTLQAVRRNIQRSRDVEGVRSKLRDWKYSQKLNTQKTYYYRYNGGG